MFFPLPRGPARDQPRSMGAGQYSSEVGHGGYGHHARDGQRVTRGIGDRRQRLTRQANSFFFFGPQICGGKKGAHRTVTQCRTSYRSPASHVRHYSSLNGPYTPGPRSPKCGAAAIGASRARWATSDTWHRGSETEADAASESFFFGPAYACGAAAIAVRTASEAEQSQSAGC